MSSSLFRAAQFVSYPSREPICSFHPLLMVPSFGLFFLVLVFFFPIDLLSSSVGPQMFLRVSPSQAYLDLDFRADNRTGTHAHCSFWISDRHPQEALRDQFSRPPLAKLPRKSFHSFENMPWVFPHFSSYSFFFDVILIFLCPLFV